MRNTFSLIVLFAMVFGYAQGDLSIAEIAEAEAKIAHAKNATHRNAFTANYDLQYQRLAFTIDPAVNFIEGEVTSHFMALENLNQILFDLDDNLTVAVVTQNGTNLSFSQTANDELIIDLPATQNLGVLDSLTVQYSGAPEDIGFGSFVQTQHNGDPIIWTLSEPYGAKTWWPCKQDLNDKIEELDVYITTPIENAQGEPYVAVSNGVEQSQVVNGATKTTHFRHQFPIPAYLVAIAATNYEVYVDVVPNNGNPFDMVNYVFPESLALAEVSTPLALPMFEQFTALFGAYPFAAEKYGHAQFTRSGGMEHTTVSFMGNYGRNLIAHELAHQWFGNKVTCGSWQDIWLNEGFATYLSGLVFDDFDGAEAFAQWREGRVNSITSEPDGSVYVQAQDTTDVGRVFNGRLSYSKGAMVLHMLRKKLGDTDFYQGTRDFLNHPNHSFGYAKTEDFKQQMETTSGVTLTQFFDDWIYGEGYPSFNVSYQQISATQVRFEIAQTQSHSSVSFFETRVPLRLLGTNSEVLDINLELTENNQEFFQPVNFTVSDVVFDPETHLISRNNTVALSTDDYTLGLPLLLYPNPSDTYVFIQKPSDLEVRKIQIFNVLGQLVKTQSFSLRLDISALSSGMHFVRFETNEGTIHKRLLKK